ncbi:MAG: secretin N-terminal domain-containing protein [Thermoanaerobaculia bacterium]
MTRRMLFALMALVFVTGTAFADAADAGKALSVRTFQFKFKQADQAAAIIKPLVSAEGSMSIQPSSNALVVTDRPDNLRAIIAVLQQYDAAARNVHLSVRLVGASRVPNAAAHEPVPELKDIANELSMLRFNAYERLGDAELQGKEGEPGLIDLSGGYRAEFKFGEYDPASDTIKLNDFRLLKLQNDQLVPLYKASLNLKLGRTVIVGATKPQGQRALMIVVVAKR